MRIIDSALVDASTPRVTAWMDVSRDNESGATEVGLRWRGLRESLAEQGAPDEVLDRVEERMLAQTHLAGPCWRLVVADAERVVADVTSPGRHDSGGGWGRVARFAPLVASTPSDLPHVLVLLDRTGADIRALVGAETTFEEEVEGENGPIRKVSPGGWSQRRFQNRAEDTWMHTAAEVAAHIDTLVRRTHPSVVVVAGDVRMVPELLDQLGEEAKQVLAVAEGGGRAEGIDEAHFDEEVERILAENYHAQVQQTVSRWREQEGRHDRAASGLQATAAALRQAQVEVLLVPEGWDDERTAWAGSDPTQLALERSELDAMGVQDPIETRVDDALLRAALGTQAEVVSVPSGVLDLRDEPAALLRWS